MKQRVAAYRQALQHTPLVRAAGVVRQVSGLSIEATGLAVGIGEQCTIRLPAAAAGVGGSAVVQAEVVGVNPQGFVLMPYGPTRGLATGCEVTASGSRAFIGVGDALLGRVIDAFGEPLDGLPKPETQLQREVLASPPKALQRKRIVEVLETGVRAIDALLTLGKGQRTGIFAGSGVGKSTLLGMIAKHVKADVNVIALIGERGREVREFVENHLGPQGLERSVVVVATSDQPALARVRAAYAAVAIAEHFREQGRQVLLTMDSVTRFAMARREIGLAAGEPPTARGYTPSVFAELPQLCERCGTDHGTGSITALMTVLVEGDDFNEPVSDHLRATLDGHVVLSRQLAHAGHYPAIDVLQSASRVMPDVVSAQEQSLALQAVGTLALLERNRQLVDIGAYEAGSNSQLDQALAVKPALAQWLQQREGGAARAQAVRQLQAIVEKACAAAPLAGQGAKA